MQTRYKVIISNQLLYREIELTPDLPRLQVGTGIDCDVRLHKNNFFESVGLIFSHTREGWMLSCSDNLYITAGDVRKLMTKQLSHGDSLQVKYFNSEHIVCNLDFFIDFDDGKRKYERAVDISSRSVVSIGAAGNSDIVLGSAYSRRDDISLKWSGDGYRLTIHQTQFGVYHNGIKVNGSCAVGNGDFISLADFFFYIKDGFLWTEIRSDMQIRSLTFYDVPTQGTYPMFKRNTRLKAVISDEKISIMDPPAKPQKPKNDLVMKLLPSMGMLLAAGFMAASGGAMIAMSAVSGGMAVLTAILNFRNSNKDYKEDSAKRISTYNAYIERKCQEIRQLREQERQELEKQYIPQQEEKQNFDEFSPNLFDRSKEDADFLTVRLGTGAREALRTIDYKKQERLEADDDLQLIPEKICQDYKMIPEAPVICDLKKTGAVGICGPDSCRFSLMKNLVVDIAARQFFSDVELVFVAREENRDKIHWLRMLPHVNNEIMGTRNIVCNDESKNLIFEYLYKELTVREQNKSFNRRIVVFFYDEYGFNSHPISKFADKAKALGVTFIFFGRRKADIPMGCGYIVELRNEYSGVLLDSADTGKAQEFTYPTISDADAVRIVDILAPVYTEEISLEGTLTKNISMFEMLNILAVDDLDLTERWAGTQVTKSMAAPLGVSKTGTVYLDLHDKAHGPHGLVAGTTGSGKSEILQTYILAMATLYHPYEVGFVIIDFKGGGMVNQFRQLPHLMGAITDIDGRQINRSLKSIKAELEKRKRCFAEADVNHIDKYIKKFKKGEVKQALPHLIIIVDEFAELKAEQPEFMKELISAARIGRSLGVHLILATQKPSGQVNEQIWSNSRFKLCLKVQSQQDSNEVIKSPLAAEIKEPGRAYLQVGNNEIFELFQSAYSGASEKAEDSDVKEFTVYSLQDSGKRVPVYQQKKQKSGEGSTTQLDAIVRYVDDYCRRKEIEKLPDICLPALDTVMDFPTRQTDVSGTGDIIADIGIFDDPENQYQGVYSMNLTAQNLMIIGSSQSGKTNLLQTIIRSVTSRYTPGEVSIYIMDFASMVLKNFDKLNHVGGVVTSSEDEKLKNLMKLLRGEIEARKEKLISVGVSSFSAYKEAGQTDLPQILLIIDNLTALKELYFHDDDDILTLCREGLSVGISVIIANSQTSGIGYKYLSNFAGRIALFCNDSSEYTSLFDHCKERLDPIPGRCVIEIEKRHLECQTYLAFRGEKEIHRVQEIHSYLAEVAKRCRQRAFRIPLIPATLTQDYMAEQFGDTMAEPFRVAAGLNYASVTPCVLDLSNLGILAVTGREKSGKHNFLRYALNMLETMYPGNTRVWAVDSVSKKLAWLKNSPALVSYGVVADDAVASVMAMEAQLKERYDALVAGNEQVLADAPLLLLVLDHPDALAAISGNRDALAACKNILSRYKSMRGCIITFVENANVPYSSPELLKTVRDQRNMLLFDDIGNLKVFDAPLALQRTFKKPIETGDCYYFRDNDCVKLKTPIAKLSSPNN